MPITLLDHGVSQQSESGAASLTPDESLSALSQKTWAAQPITARLRILKRARHLLASRIQALCEAIPSTLSRNAADTRCAEIIPLLAACKFLEQNAAEILKPRRLRRRHRPLWLSGVTAEVHRVPMGRILVIAPSNYPLFIPGVQILQALAAGNSVTWKPAPGGGEIALLLAQTLYDAGLPHQLLQITDESIEAAQSAIAMGVDKVFFTGSAASGRLLLHQLADTLTPCVAELSGCDAIFVLPSADLSRVVKALGFGMRLNGSATCMAPRRIILVGADTTQKQAFIAQLKTALDWIPGVALSQKVQRELQSLIEGATQSGAQIHGKLTATQQPLLVTGATTAMQVAHADIFAPILTLLNAHNISQAIAANEACPFALTASIFGEESEARALASSITAGTVLINDLMVPAADPRTPFGGRNQSGFGVTQGTEGLLEMTAPKTITTRRGSSTRHYDGTAAIHEQLFDGVIQSTHAATFKQRLAGVTRMIAAASKMNRS